MLYVDLDKRTELSTAIVDALKQERAYQHQKFPGHKHTVCEWIAIQEDILGKAKKAWHVFGDDAALHEIRQLTATGVACMEEHGAPLRGDSIQTKTGSFL